MKSVYEVCPECQSPEFEDSGNYYKCITCGNIFDFPEEVPIEEKCPYCDNLNVDAIEADDYGKCTFKCVNCEKTWRERRGF